MSYVEKHTVTNFIQDKIDAYSAELEGLGLNPETAHRSTRYNYLQGAIVALADVRNGLDSLLPDNHGDSRRAPDDTLPGEKEKEEDKEPPTVVHLKQSVPIRGVIPIDYSEMSAAFYKDVASRDSLYIGFLKKEGDENLTYAGECKIHLGDRVAYIEGTLSNYDTAKMCASLTQTGPLPIIKLDCGVPNIEIIK